MCTTAYMVSYGNKQSIRKCGATTYDTTGVIYRTSIDLEYSGHKVNDLIRSDALVLPGDSGGVVYCLFDGVYVVAGTVAAAEFMGNTMNKENFVFSYFSKVNNQIEALGVGIY